MAARRSDSLPLSAAAYSASVGMRPAKISAARRSVFQFGASTTVSNSVRTVNTAGAEPGAPPSCPRNRCMFTKSADPAATCMPPPCDTPWILFST